MNVAGQSAPGAAGSVLTVTQVSAGGTLATWSTTAGTVGSASVCTTASAGTVGSATLSTNAGTATVCGTATVSNAWAMSNGTVNTAAAAAPGASGSVMISSSANTATWGVVTAAAGAPPGAATGTAGGITAAGPTDIGPTYTVPANTVGTGTSYFMSCTGSWNDNVNSKGTIGVYWGGVAGVQLTTIANVGASGLFEAQAQLYWQTNSEVSVALNYAVSGAAGVFAGSVVTGLTTTSNEALTFGWTNANASATGTVTPRNAFVNQVH